MEKRVITVTLNPAVDRTVTVPGFAVGGIFVKGAEQITAGGKGINVSRALNVLGVTNLATGILGGCSGKITLLKLMRQERVSQDFYKFGGYSRTNVTIVDPQRGTTTQLLESGPKLSTLQIDEFLLKFKAKLSSCSFLIISGRNAVGVSDDIYAQLIKLAHDRQIPVLLDAHGQAFKLGLAQRPLIATPNLKEAEELLGRSLKTASSLKNALRAIYQTSGGWVFIKSADKGVVAFDGQDYWQSLTPVIKVKNGVGCGDAFSAGLVNGYLKKMSFAKMLAYATAAAAASALTSVPALLTLKDLKSLLNKTKVVRLN